MNRLWISILFLLCFCRQSLAQKTSFPSSWEGNWKGELQWFKNGKPGPQQLSMELNIHKTDTAGSWSWQLVYGNKREDDRPYKLVRKDSTGQHWVIDERNGILLDQFWIGDKLCGAFTVQNTTIVNSYRMENDRLIIEFYSLSAKPLSTTGQGTDESPQVDSYRVGSYQKAILKRMK